MLLDRNKCVELLFICMSAPLAKLAVLQIVEAYERQATSLPSGKNKKGGDDDGFW